MMVPMWTAAATDPVSDCRLERGARDFATLANSHATQAHAAEI